MKIRKLALTIVLIFFGVALLSAQNLAELAKKEKARRAALRAQGKVSVVVTNADLRKRNKLPVVSASSASSASSRPQRNTRSTSNPPPRSSKITPPQQEGRIRDRSPEVYQNRKYATQVLLSSELVNNPEFALQKPDGKFAELSLQGVLELEVSVKNGPGADIAIYSRMSGAQAAMPGGEEEGGIPETLGVDLIEGFWYGVMAMDKNGEWQALGRGRGSGASEKFDLGKISSTKKIRIIFRPLSSTDLHVKHIRSHSRELTCGIDAIEVLH